MPRVTRSNSIQNIVDVESSPEKDDKSKVKVQIASERREQPHSQRVMIVPGLVNYHSWIFEAS